MAGLVNKEQLSTFNNVDSGPVAAFSKSRIFPDHKETEGVSKSCVFS